MRRTVLMLAALAALLAVTAPGGLAQAAVDLAKAQTFAASGEQAYEDGDFSTAADEFEAALELGLDHAVVHYNLGNAHYKQGHLGRAIASYLRALRRDPRDASVRANLEQARGFLQDEALAPLALPVFLKPLGWLYARVSLNEWAWLTIGGVALLSLTAVAGQWRVGPRSLRRNLSLAWIVGSVFCFAMMSVHYRAEVQRTTAVVIAEEVEVRSGPGPSYNIAFKIHEGLQVYVSERRDQWYQVHLGGELVGWVPAEQLETL